VYLRFGAKKTSSELMAILQKQVEDDYKKELAEIDKGIDRFKSLLLRIAKVKKWDLTLWSEGFSTHFQQYERDFTLLEKSNLIKGKTKYTERNKYREYQLTKKGRELVEKLQKENLHQQE
jgi:hypothetical protein